MSKRSSKRFFAVIFLIVFFLTVYFAVFSVSMIAKVCTEEARAEIINIVNASNEAIQKLDVYYEDYFTIFRDKDDKITLITANSSLINQINMIIQTEIQNRLNALRVKTLYLPSGAFTGIPFLSSYGTKVPVNARILSNCYTVLTSEFSEMGINQTLHRLTVSCFIEIKLTVPAKSVKEDVTNEILLTESVIVGDVPSTYLGEKTTTDYLDLLPN